MKESLQVSYLGRLQLGEGDRQGELELGERERLERREERAAARDGLEGLAEDGEGCSGVGFYRPEERSCANARLS